MESEEHFFLNWLVMRKCFVYFEEIGTGHCLSNHGCLTVWNSVFNKVVFLSRRNMNDTQRRCLPYGTNFIRREWIMAMYGNRFSVTFGIQTRFYFYGI
jgi:hypothetical protein